MNAATLPHVINVLSQHGMSSSTSHSKSNSHSRWPGFAGQSLRGTVTVRRRLSRAYGAIYGQPATGVRYVYRRRSRHWLQLARQRVSR